MSLKANETLEILEGAKSFEHGKIEVSIVRGLTQMYGDRREKDYTTCEEDDLRQGLILIFDDIKRYIELQEKEPTSERLPGATHNDQMFKGRIENAVNELKGNRASSSNLIELMPFISARARDIEVEAHYEKFYPFNLPKKFKTNIARKFYRKNCESGEKARKNSKWISYSEEDALKREDYINAVEKRVKDSAPRWEEEARAARLSKTEVDSKRS